MEVRKLVRRSRRRYLLVKLLSGKTHSRDSFQSAVRNSVQGLFGESGLAEVNPKVVVYRERKQEAVVRCPLKSVERLRAAVAFITEIEGEQTSAFVLKTSGTIKGIKI